MRPKPQCDSPTLLVSNMVGDVTVARPYWCQWLVNITGLQQIICYPSFPGR